MLKRGKEKFKVLDFEGEMLFQGHSDHVQISLTSKAATFAFDHNVNVNLNVKPIDE